MPSACRLVVLVSLSCVAVAWAEGAQDPFHRVVGLLQYLEGDYGQAWRTNDAAELAEQAGLADEVVVTFEREPGGAPFLPEAQAIKAAIVAHQSEARVTALLRALSQSVISQRGLTLTPHRRPDLALGKKVFEQQCALCHGVSGDGQGPAAAQLTPAPANFHDAARMGPLSPARVFTTTTFGIPKTAMAAFASLSDAERWSVAFYLFTLRQPQCTGPAASVSVEELATSSDAVLASKYGNALACLRTRLPESSGSTLPIAVAGLEAARKASRAGHHQSARQALVDAYLEGVEPVEPSLRGRDAALVASIEAGFTKARLTAQAEQSLDADVANLEALLERARRVSDTTQDFWAVFFTALLILVREGFEAVVVVGALLAVLKKVEATRHARVVHLGWVSALIFGAIAFVFGHHLLAGANREWLEAVVGLFAVVMLLYAALWLNSRATMSRFMTELRHKMSTALGRGSLAGLFAISFTSVGRETVETALFLQGLANDSLEGASWGAVAGLVTLSGLVWLMRVVGFALPMKTLFRVSTVLLVATAVMVLGGSVHSLQELGYLPLLPVRFVTFSSVGVFADGVSLGLQAVLVTLPLGYWLAHHASHRARTT